MTKWTRLSTILIGGALLAGIQPPLQAQSRDSTSHVPGAVYALSNALDVNRVLVFHRAANGSLVPAGSVASGGVGTSAGLGSQGALVLSGDREWLFAVNAGSNSISSFRVHADGLVLMDTVASGGITPVSLTVRGHLLYVLNQGGTGNIAGFWVGSNGRLTPVPDSTQPLSSSDAGAAEIAFSPDQETLVVSEKKTNVLDTYKILDHGRVSGPTVHTSNGNVPYGFTFTGRDELLVTEAGSNAVSSYDLDAGTVTTMDASVPSEGAAPCWITATPNGRFAYATNAHIGTIAGFKVGHEGALSFLGLTATTSVPLLDVTATQNFLYALAGGTHQILAYRVNTDGSLTAIGTANGLPATAVGLVVR